MHNFITWFVRFLVRYKKRGYKRVFSSSPELNRLSVSFVSFRFMIRHRWSYFSPQFVYLLVEDTKRSFAHWFTSNRPFHFSIHYGRSHLSAHWSTRFHSSYIHWSRARNAVRWLVHQTPGDTSIGYGSEQRDSGPWASVERRDAWDIKWATDDPNQVGMAC